MKLLLPLFILLLGGCAADVKPWQKPTLSKESMRPGGGDALRVKFNEHIFVSKEGIKGGNGVSGGGCGCR